MSRPVHNANVKENSWVQRSLATRSGRFWLKFPILAKQWKARIRRLDMNSATCQTSPFSPGLELDTVTGAMGSAAMTGRWKDTLPSTVAHHRISNKVDVCMNTHKQIPTTQQEPIKLHTKAEKNNLALCHTVTNIVTLSPTFSRRVSDQKNELTTKTEQSSTTVSFLQKEGPTREAKHMSLPQQKPNTEWQAKPRNQCAPEKQEVQWLTRTIVFQENILNSPWMLGGEQQGGCPVKAQGRQMLYSNALIKAQQSKVSSEFKEQEAKHCSRSQWNPLPCHCSNMCK